MYDIGLAITRTGFIGPAHTEALRRRGVRLEGILNSSPEKSRRFAEQYKLPKTYGSCDEILRDPNEEQRWVTLPQAEIK